MGPSRQNLSPRQKTKRTLPPHEPPPLPDQPVGLALLQPALTHQRGLGLRVPPLVLLKLLVQRRLHVVPHLGVLEQDHHVLVAPAPCNIGHHTWSTNGSGKQ